jgi:uncharacterized circularly permuted ATP-grasp superfamily protein
MKNVIEELIKRKLFLDYPYEQAMARTEPSGKYFIKFYGWDKEKEVEGNHIILNEVLRYGEKITKEEYEKDGQ